MIETWGCYDGGSVIYPILCFDYAKYANVDYTCFVFLL